MIDSRALLWSRSIRILHWSLAAAVVANLFFLDGHEDFHKWTGYFALSIVVLRLGWGLRGNSGHSRLSELPLRISDFLKFFSTLLQRSNSAFPGHNPLASVNYILIWSAVILLAQTGWMLSWERYFGEEWLEDLHIQISTVLEVLVVIHLLGIAYDSIRYRRATWLAMVRGRR